MSHYVCMYVVLLIEVCSFHLAPHQTKSFLYICIPNFKFSGMLIETFKVMFIRCISIEHKCGLNLTTTVNLEGADIVSSMQIQIVSETRSS